MLLNSPVRSFCHISSHLILLTSLVAAPAFAVDSDSDGVNDATEIFYGFDPSNAASTPILIHEVSQLIYGANAQYGFGSAAKVAGDVNNDGVQDFIVGASGSNLNTGFAYVYSGIDGTELYAFTGDSNDDRFGESVSGAGDVNNDGYDDFIIGAPADDNGGNRAGSATVYSGIDGSVLYSYDGTFSTFGAGLGSSVSGLGDVNNDNYDDFLIGAFCQANASGACAGVARLYSGIDGSVLYTFNGQSFSGNSEQLGDSISGGADINNDNVPDIIVSAHAYYDGVNVPGRVYVYSGKDRTLLHTLTGGDTARGKFGNSTNGTGVSGLSDINADNCDDIIVGSQDEDNANGNSYGVVRVYSGCDGSVLLTIIGDNGNNDFGRSVADAGDIDGDEINDIIVGGSNESRNGNFNGTARFYSGADGSEILHNTFFAPSAGPFFGTQQASRFGHAISSMGDLNSDGIADFIIGAENENDETGASVVLGTGTLRLYLSNISNVLSDTTAPVILLTGSTTINRSVGGTYTDAGATASDDTDGNISANIITVNPVNVNIVDSYIITYNISDAAGNAATEVTRTVNVIAAPDTTPNAFSFTDATGAENNALIVSNVITISGIDAQTPISINGGEMSVNGGAYTSTSGTVVNGNTVQLRATSSNSSLSTKSVTLTIGGVSGQFDITTADSSNSGTTPTSSSSGSLSVYLLILTSLLAFFRRVNNIRLTQREV